MSDFSDRPFVAGSLVGLRAFSVDRLGRLVGPYVPQVFTPEENVAKCRRGEVALATWNPFASLRTGANERPRVEESKPKGHTVGSLTCSCGFYAYFDGGNDHDGQERVAAVVEGYGVCTVGSRGFRAEKARLLALVVPSSRFDWFHRLSRWADAKIGVGGVLVGMIGVGIALGAAALTIEASPFWAPLFLVAALCVLISVASFHGITCDVRPNHFAAVRRNYAGVPIFRSTRAALAAFPLSAPPEPTPETCDDFWTRSAR